MIAPSLPDTQNESDSRGVAIAQVGVSRVSFPMSVEMRSGASQATVGKAKLTVSLAASRRGTHMSRFVQALFAHEGPWRLQDDPAALAKELQGRLQAEEAEVLLNFPFFLLKAAPVSQEKGWLDYQVTVSAVARGAESTTILTVEAPVATLCPCSKAISEGGAHNQRGTVRFSVRSSSKIWLEDMIEMVEASASCGLYSVLKRSDEKYVTEYAYANPAFVEDVAREVALRARRHEGIQWFRIEVENEESIHHHNAFAMVEETK